MTCNIFLKMFPGNHRLDKKPLTKDQYNCDYALHNSMTTTTKKNNNKIKHYESRDAQNSGAVAKETSRKTVPTTSKI